MSQLISSSVVVNANKLNLIWKNNWEQVKEQEASNKKITQGIDSLRSSIRTTIKALR